MHATYDGKGYVSFATTHFSTYILTTEKLDEDKDGIPNTGAALFLIPVAAAAAAVIFTKKRS